MRCRSCGQEIGFGDSVDNGICSNCRAGASQGRGVLGAGAGLVFLSFRLLSRGSVGLWTLVLGVAVMVLGIVFLVRRNRPVYDGQEVDQGPDGPEQVVGKTCSVCDQKVVSVVEAARCEKCGAPLHEECQHKHLVAVHSGSKKHPYRK